MTFFDRRNKVAVRLEEIDPENWRLGLKVLEAQKNYVSDSAELLARAYAYRKSRSNALVIYNDDIPVGMALYYDLDEMNAYDFSQLFIDERYQRKGFGIEAARQIIERMERDGKFDFVKKGLCPFLKGKRAGKNREFCGIHGFFPAVALRAPPKAAHLRDIR